MLNLKILSLLLVILVLTKTEIIPPKPSYTRTMLKVSRSLPGETEELKVRTSEGNIATLIVKRRDKSIKNTENKNNTIENESKNWVPIKYNEADEWKPLESTSPKPPKQRDSKYLPAEVIIRSELNVKPQPGVPTLIQQIKRSPMVLDTDGVPIIHGKRVPDEPIDKIQTWRNARVINDQLVTDKPQVINNQFIPTDNKNFQTFFDGVNRRYSKGTEDENINKLNLHRNDILSAEIYQTSSSDNNYRPSIHKRMLQPELQSANYPNSKIYSPTTDSQQKIKPGSRTPVLQYAHPELGVQPAKVIKNDNINKDVVTAEAQQRHLQQTPTYQKKKYVLNNKNIVDSYSVKNYYPNQHFYGIKRPIHEAPFWVKISENLRNQLNDGVQKVSEYTKPVFDPLMEATRKISQNLGLSPRSQDVAQDKIGTVATAAGSSALIPALGLVASGAALGIGAVAVGRYLDVDVLKRSNEENGFNRRKRNTLWVEKDIPIVQRRGADLMDQIVEIDVSNYENQRPEELFISTNHLVNKDEFQENRKNLNLVNKNWSNTQCAKKIFCDEMIKKDSDDIRDMDKRMHLTLKMLSKKSADLVTPHLDEVMDAVKNNNCTKFICSTTKSY